MTRRRTPKPPAPTPEQGATTMTVNLQSREYANKLLNDLREADSKAKDAKEKSNAAFADADRLNQAVAQMNTREEKLRAELDQLQRDREEARQRAEEAATYGKRLGAARDEYAAQAADAAMFLGLAGITVDPNLLVPTSGPNGQVLPAGPIELDPTADGRMQRFNAAHDEQAATEPEPKL